MKGTVAARLFLHRLQLKASSKSEEMPYSPTVPGKPVLLRTDWMEVIGDSCVSSVLYVCTKNNPEVGKLRKHVALFLHCGHWQHTCCITGAKKFSNKMCLFRTLYIFPVITENINRNSFQGMRTTP